MLESIVASRLGVRGFVITGEGENVTKELAKIRGQTGFGQTLVRLGAGTKDSWLRQRSELLKAMNPTKPGVQVCEDGVCKEVLEVGNAV
jgi:hypothetical protein